jgi:hypothetical protein
MGNHTNSSAFNLVSWVTVVIMIILTALMTIDIMSPGIVGRLLGL